MNRQVNFIGAVITAFAIAVGLSPVPDTNAAPAPRQPAHHPSGTTAPKPTAPESTDAAPVVMDVVEVAPEVYAFADARTRTTNPFIAPQPRVAAQVSVADDGKVTVTDGTDSAFALPAAPLALRADDSWRVPRTGPLTTAVRVGLALSGVAKLTATPFAVTFFALSTGAEVFTTILPNTFAQKPGARQSYFDALIDRRTRFLRQRIDRYVYGAAFDVRDAFAPAKPVVTTGEETGPAPAALERTPEPMARAAALETNANGGSIVTAASTADAGYSSVAADAADVADAEESTDAAATVTEAAGAATEATEVDDE